MRTSEPARTFGIGHSTLMGSLRDVNGLPKVEILLSTFNGEAFARRLLDSLSAQDYPNLTISIRDDGSTDRTMRILREYARRSNVIITSGHNVGVVKSFFLLLETALLDSDYVAFADQDDVWKLQKVSRAIRMLEAQVPREQPGLYCAGCVICDAELNPIGKMPLPRRGPSFANSLVENIATGCTVVLNRAARELLLRDWPKDVVFHDWWCYQVVAGAGKVVYDPEPVLLYRQHGDNATGVGLTAGARLLRKVRRQVRGGSRNLARRQAEELKRIFYDALSPEHQRILDEFLLGQATLSSRIRYAFKGAAHRQHLTDDLALKALYVLNRV